MPGSPGNRCANVNPYGFDSSAGATLRANARRERTRPCPPDARDGFWNNASIFKLQYQHNMGSNAYFRIYGYTFYSDWLQTSPLSYGTPFFGFGVPRYDYELESHTRGLAVHLRRSARLRSTLLTFDVNYTTATTNRYNNTNFNNTSAPTRPTSPTVRSASPVNRRPSSASTIRPGQPAPCNSPLTSGYVHRPPNPEAPAFPARTGRSRTPETPASSTTSCRTSPRSRCKIYWNPTDKLNVNLGLRGEDLRIQSRQHDEQRPELLVPGRAARVLLQPGHARAVLHSVDSPPAGVRRRRSSASTAPSTTRFPRIPCRRSTPTAKTATCS